MKATFYIILLVILLLPGTIFSVINLLGTKRHVTVQYRHDHGAVIINAKKVRVSYTIQETAIPVQTGGAVEFLFLSDNQACLVTALIQLIMGLLLIFIYYVNTLENRLRKYRVPALRALFLTVPIFILSEICSHYIRNAWLIDTKNGINGNVGLFGANATFLNMAPGSLNLDYQPSIQLFIIPLMAAVVALLNAKNKDDETVAG